MFPHVAWVRVISTYDLWAGRQDVPEVYQDVYFLCLVFILCSLGGLCKWGLEGAPLQFIGVDLFTVSLYVYVCRPSMCVY